MISLNVEMPQELHQALRAFLDLNKAESQDSVMAQALRNFLMEELGDE